MYGGIFKKDLLFDASTIGTVEKISEEESSGPKGNVLKVMYELKLDPEKFKEAVLQSARTTARLCVKNLQRKTEG